MVYTKDLKSFAFTGLWVRVPPSAPEKIMPKKFTRKIEDFKCEHCGTEVQGNGYTNHCPHCLYSKHVDLNPGDRLSACKGLMKPIAIKNKSGEYTLTHQCIICGYTKDNKTVPEDNFDAILAIASGK